MKREEKLAEKLFILEEIWNQITKLPFCFLGIFQVNEEKEGGCLSEASFLPRRMSEDKIPLKKAGGVLLFVLFLDEQEKDITLQSNTVKKSNEVPFFGSFAFASKKRTHLL